MEPSVVLAVGSGAARLAGWIGADALDGRQQAPRAGLAPVFVFTGLAHFAPTRGAIRSAWCRRGCPGPACSSPCPGSWNWPVRRAC